MDVIIVFSHLRWNFVYQRPQHLLSRLARHYQVIFFEEPAFRQAEARYDISNPVPNLSVWKPLTPVAAPGFHQAQIPYLRQAVRQLGKQHPGAVAWLYTPMALPLLDDLAPRCVVYDCMDELSAFKESPPQLVAHEAALLGLADIVFTGGPSLHHAKKHRNTNSHCFASSVDVSHFRRALDRNIAYVPHRALPSPRLGFYGVIDERFDTALIAQMADRHPEWQIVLVGPVAKIDPASLPKRPNILFMGQQDYATLPQFLASWDVCLMPFAINASTRFISPTKSLEYMAAELPIVSTAVRDVVDLHSDVIEIAATAEEFICACERALVLSPEARHKKIQRMRTKLAATSWDQTAQRMDTLIRKAAGKSASRASFLRQQPGPGTADYSRTGES